MTPIQTQALNNELVYLERLRQLRNAPARGDRTGTGTLSDFGGMDAYDIRNNVVPLISTKKVFHRGIKEELVWMLSGVKSIKPLLDKGVHIWDDWLVPGTDVRDDKGNLIDGITSSIYGESWREIEDTRVLTMEQYVNIPDTTIEGRPQEQFRILGELNDPISGVSGMVVSRDIDQIARVMWQLRNNPEGRRILFSAWNPARVDDVTLPPCHVMAQFYVQVIDGEKHLSCQMYQRSADYGLGVAFNIVFYATLTHLMAAATGMKGHTLKHVMGDMHVYQDQLPMIDKWLEREPVVENEPIVVFDGVDETTDITEVTSDQIHYTGYQSLSKIDMPVAV